MANGIARVSLTKEFAHKGYVDQWDRKGDTQHVIWRTKNVGDILYLFPAVSLANETARGSFAKSYGVPKNRR